MIDFDYIGVAFRDRATVPACEQVCADAGAARTEFSGVTGIRKHNYLGSEALPHAPL